MGKEAVKWGAMIFMLGLNTDLDKHEFFEHLPGKNYFTYRLDSNYFNSSIWRKLGSVMGEPWLLLLAFVEHHLQELATISMKNWDKQQGHVGGLLATALKEISVKDGKNS